jgi:hypothetical protein
MSPIVDRRPIKLNFINIKRYVAYNSAVNLIITLIINILTYGPDARQRLRNRQVYDSRYCVMVSQTSMFLRQREDTTMSNGISVRFVPRCYKQDELLENAIIALTLRR